MTLLTRRIALSQLAVVSVAACALLPKRQEKPPRPMQDPLIIAHRGASGLRPEHTASAYRLAIAQGADFIEPDLVLTKDAVLVCRHENEIGGTTDVAKRSEFAARRTVKTVDGERVEGWFTEDFTLAELKTLRCRERLPQLRPQNTAYDGQDQILTFEEALDLAAEEGARANRVVGVYPETKHPSYFDALGLSHDAPLLAALEKRGFRDAESPIFIQSFEVNNLRRLGTKTRVRRVQLASADGGPFDQPGQTYKAMLTGSGLIRISTYAQAIGVEKTLIQPRDAAGRSLPFTSLIADAHAAGLKVHAWTFRAENYFLPLERRNGAEPAVQGDMEGELRAMFAAGLDGAFCDFPAIGVAARRRA